MKIVCVCGMGLGSSVIAKMNIEPVLKNRALDATVDSCDLGSDRCIHADLYVTTRELAISMPAELQSKTIILTNFVRKDEIEITIVDYLRQQGC